jgi:NAD(P)-dependent dehydrogenase (short-subunit alcohol dehydrogenase family)
MKRIALITGTTRGLGKEIAKHFLYLNWNVIGLARGESTINHSNYAHIQVDIKDRKALKAAIDTIDVNINLLVNNSSIFTMKSFDETDDETIENIIDINLKGTIFTTKYALQHMSPGSRIFFINSVAGLEELEKQSIYCASKHGMTAFAGVLGNELREKKIKVTSIHPGGINTTLWNEKNPYPCGDVNLATEPREIAILIEFIYNSFMNTEYKTVKIFPTTEWHQ